MTGSGHLAAMSASSRRLVFPEYCKVMDAGAVTPPLPCLLSTDLPMPLWLDRSQSSPHGTRGD